MHKSWKTIVPIIFLVVVVTSSLILLGHSDLKNLVSSAGYWGPIFLVFLKLGTIVVAPLGGEPLYFIAPPLFGLWPSFFYLSLGDILGYSIVFWISRTYGRQVMNKVLSENQITWADKMLKYMGNWKGLTLVRVVFAPFADTISYASGLTKISFKEYFLATVPIILIYTLVVTSIGERFIQEQSDYLIVVASVLIVSLTLFLLRKNIKGWFERFFSN